jgi:rare lipoprotein A
VEVTNLDNGRRLQVRLNDRGPFVDGRLIDLSRGAAEQLGFDRQGLARVRVRYIGAAPPLAAEGVMQARLSPHHAVIVAPERAPDLTAPLEPAPTATAATPRPTPVETAALPPIGGAAWALPATTFAPPAVAPIAAAPPTPPSAEAGEADFRVQVGAYPSRTDATRAAAHLGEDVRYMIEAVDQRGVTAYRVVLGGFLDEDDALAAQLRYSAAGFPGARVIRPF